MGPQGFRRPQLNQLTAASCVKIPSPFLHEMPHLRASLRHSEEQSPSVRKAVADLRGGSWGQEKDYHRGNEFGVQSARTAEGQRHESNGCDDY